MKKLLRKLGFRPQDEMEQLHNFKAQRNAYFFLIVALLIWTVAESLRVYIHHTTLNLMPSMLLIIATLIQTFSRLILTRNAVKDDPDSYETSPLIRIVLLTCIVAAIIATVGAVLLIGGVRA